jgi:asparagine synthase (glutamine-hydrolysing)
MERERYWDPTEAFGRRFSSIREEEAIRECDRLLVSAARYRMVADVPVGLFLSGGYDSTAVAAVLQQGMGEPLRTYTIGFHELEYDEAPFARKVAAWLGTRHCELYCTQKDALEMVWRLPEMFDEPFGDVSGLPTLLVSRLARQEVKVAMSADAGDETFGGYARYRDALRLHRMMQAVPGAARRAAARVLCAVPDGLVPGLLGRRNGFGRREKGAMLLAGSGPRRVLEEQLSVYSSREAARLVPGAKGVRDLFGEPGWPRGLTPLRQMQLADFRWYLPDDILAKVDRTSMAVSLEAREPLLDHRLLEFAAALPDRFKVRGGTLKWLLRQVVHRRVPRGLVERPKRGFGVPIGSWLKGELRPLMEECLEERRLRAQGLFDPARVAVEKRRFLEGGQADASRIWFLVAFQMWHGRWIGR